MSKYYGILLWLACTGNVWAWEGMALELGANKEKFTGEEWAHSVAIVSSIRRKDNFYGEWLIGSLNGELKPSAFLFGSVGYWQNLSDDWYFRASFGVGFVSQTGWKLSTVNEFTESLSLGWKGFYASYRHISNGGDTIDNPGNNNGEDILTLGYMHEL